MLFASLYTNVIITYIPQMSSIRRNRGMKMFAITVEGIRYDLLGSSQIDPAISFVVLSGFTVMMVVVGSYLFRKISI